MAILGSLASLRLQAPPGLFLGPAVAYLAALLDAGSEAGRRLAALGAGESRRIDLGADGLHAMEQAYLTRAPGEGRWESHRAHLDLQVVAAGEERIELAEIATLDVEEDLTPGKDVVFYRPCTAASSLRLAAGDAALLFPSDAHLGGLRTGAPCLVRKTVVKIPFGR
jgi:biofilm protein TabA